ncbi:hypothetical protein TNCV_435621 [Trichonephila clavipes]|nr:hypothetical protein TNCV_435621 [Trichonephila clavipes]
MRYACRGDDVITWVVEVISPDDGSSCRRGVEALWLDETVSEFKQSFWVFAFCVGKGSGVGISLIVWLSVVVVTGGAICCVVLELEVCCIACA